MEALAAAGRATFAEFVAESDNLYHPLVHADYLEVARALTHLRSDADRFLEWGSGVGTISIMADLLGYDAVGIEIDSRLIERAEDLAREFHSEVVFVQGSFVPEEFQEEPDFQSAEFIASGDGSSAYAQLGDKLSDFDLIYAFPWPGEEQLHIDIMRRHARADALLLLYASRDGLQIYREGELLPFEI
ncbi:MAG: methyltransferase domain-containing protein [Planctomycetota bacterium]